MAERIPDLTFEVNGLTSVELPSLYPGLSRRPDLRARIRAEEERLLKSAKRIVTVSEVTRKCLIAMKAPEDRISVIPNGFDDQLFFPQDDKFPDLTLVYVGTLAPWQGIDFMLMHLRRYLRSRSDLRVVMIATGSADRFRAYRAVAAELGLKRRIEWHRHLSHAETAELVRKSHIGLACLARGARNERQGCCPLKILEYMGAGLPVIAADLPVVREIVTDPSMLYRASSAASFRRNLESWIDQPEKIKEPGLAASREIHAKFTWRAHRSQLETCLGFS